MKFRAITYNLHKGRSFLTRKSVLKELKESLSLLKVDIVFLQEVMGLEGGESHLEYFADSLFDHLAYGKNAVRDDDHYGNAILSRFPIVNHSNRNISTNRFERRGSLQARVKMEAELELSLFCVHLDLLERGRTQQVQNIIHQVRHQVDEKTPFLIAGDFNDWRGRICDPIRTELQAKNVFNGRDKLTSLTFPSFFPRVALDRFYYNNLKVVDVEVLKGNPWNRLSDHCPVLATFETL